MGVYMNETEYHVPVMVDEVLEYLLPKKGCIYIDCTLGGGGHSKRILEAMHGEGMCIGIDRDQEAIVRATSLLKNEPNFRAVKGSFENIEELVHSCGVEHIDGCLFDLGVSSHQLDCAERGFSFRNEAKLDMRMDASEKTTACDLVNTLPSRELERIFRDYGDERYARRIADTIEKTRQLSRIETTVQLSSLIEKCVPFNRNARHFIHPATRVFMALRIAVNRELKQLESGLKGALRLMNPKGRAVVVSYHSAEDRIVKNIFRDLSVKLESRESTGDSLFDGRLVKKLFKKVLLPSAEEEKQNARARSAKMRAVEVVF